MTKYFSPSFSYMRASLADGLQVEVDVFGGVLRVGEHDHPVVRDDHAPVVGRHDLLEVVVAEVRPAERLGDLVVGEVELTGAVDADHRRELLDRAVRVPARVVGGAVGNMGCTR